MEVRIGNYTKCKIKGCYITSPRCQACESYVKHRNETDGHGRIDCYIIECKKITQAMEK